MAHRDAACGRRAVLARGLAGRADAPLAGQFDLETQGSDSSHQLVASATLADGQIQLANVQGTGPRPTSCSAAVAASALLAREYDLTVDYERVSLAASAVPTPARARLARAWTALRGSVARRGWTEAPEARRVQWHGTWDCRAAYPSSDASASDRLPAMRVAAIQMTSGHDIEANLEAAGRFLARPRG